MFSQMDSHASSMKGGDSFREWCRLRLVMVCVIQCSYALQHSKNPGQEQLQKDLSRYRSTKPILKQLFKDRNNYEASDEWLLSKLFAENSESLRIMLEYTNSVGPRVRKILEQELLRIFVI